MDLSGSEQRERLVSTSRQAPLGQGLSALVRNHHGFQVSTIAVLPELTQIAQNIA